MSDDIGINYGIMIGPMLIPLLLFLFFFWCFCWPMCRGKIRSCNATALPPAESQRIINSMQGDWDVTLTPGTCMCGCKSYERMTVTGSILARVYSGRGANRPIQLRPAKTDDGTLLLDTYGSKAIVFTPEQGHMQTELMGWNLEWKKVGWQENMTDGQGRGAGQEPSSGQGGVADEIQRLHRLKQQGILTEEEFNGAKYKILNPGEPSGGSSAPYEQPPPYSVDLEAGFPLKQF